MTHESEIAPPATAPRTPPVSVRLLSVGAAVVLLSWGVAARAPTGRWAVLADNVHWTVGYLVGTLLALVGVRAARGAERRLRAWGALGLAALTTGQVLWDLQVYTGHNPFPAPSDAFFLLLGPAYAVGLAVTLRNAFPAEQRDAVLLDVVGFGVAVATFSLTLYLPAAAHSTPFQLTVFTLYPVLLLCTSVVAVVVGLHLRQQWSPPNLGVLAGLGVHGILWMLWNYHTINGTLGNGTLLNVSFSLTTLALGWSTGAWHLARSPSPAFDRRCEALLRLVPLVTSACASTSLVVLLTGPRLPAQSQPPLLLCGLLVLIIAVVRQTRQLGERDRLLEAERRAADSSQRLQHLAHHDPLTGLPNLTLLRDRTQQAILEARRSGGGVAFLFLDLDQFKEVNDSLGHPVGDLLLRHIARALRERFRESDTVSRPGGDEFVVVLREVTDRHAVAALAEKLMRLSSDVVELDGHQLPMSMSLGIAMYPADGESFEALQQAADTAMYKAKAAGRNTYRFYDPQMNRDAAERIRLRARMSRGLERGEFAIHYQPQLDLRTRALVGFEALLRWHSPDLGSVSPGQFIPVAEDSGQIVELGAWVLRRACDDAAAWRAPGLAGLTVAVNLSGVQLRRSAVEELVSGALRASGLAPERLELEITESVLMVERERILGVVSRLKALGVHMALDDFGTGYASLAHVKLLNLGTLKIDRSLIAGCARPGPEQGLVKAAVDMAAALGMASLAEGVETDEQCALLQSIGCQRAQGYLFGRPMPLHDLEGFVRAHAAGPPPCGPG